MYRLTKKLVTVVILLFLLSTAFVISCGKKADSEANDHPSEQQSVAPEEPTDSTDHPSGSEHPTDSASSD